MYVRTTNYLFGPNFFNTLPMPMICPGSISMQIEGKKTTQVNLIAIYPSYSIQFTMPFASWLIQTGLFDNETSLKSNLKLVLMVLLYELRKKFFLYLFLLKANFFLLFVCNHHATSTFNLVLHLKDYPFLPVKELFTNRNRLGERNSFKGFFPFAMQKKSQATKHQVGRTKQVLHRRMELFFEEFEMFF
jgi:hypothetical protein